MRTPTLIAIGGFAGAGKTTMSRRLAATYNFPVFSSDEINTGLRKALDKEFHEVSPAAYEVLWHVLADQLSIGMTCILDTHMAYARNWQMLDNMKQEIKGLRVVPIILECDLETHKQRIDERGRTNKKHLNLGGGRLEDAMHKYEFIKSLKRSDLIRVDANGTPEVVYGNLERVLRKADVIGD